VFSPARAYKFVSFSKSISQDHNKPLLIPAGSDAMQQIGGIGATRTGTISKGPGTAIDRWKHTFTTHFPQVIIIYKYSALINRQRNKLRGL
jgi:hypothetical protein